jgi:hypothetical protein
MLICDKCKATISAGSRFCGQCGDPVTEADQPKNAIAIPAGKSATITFSASSSPSYEKALSLCSKIPTFTTAGEGKSLQHSVTLPLSEVDLITNIFDLVGSWKSSRMTIDGGIATKKDLTYGCLGCYKNRQKAYKPEGYCFGESNYDANIWGCKRLSMPINEWGGGWLEFGDFNSSGVWRFDKKRIEHDLRNGISQNENCPAFNAPQILETLSRLPDTIDPRSDSNWRYRTSYEQTNGEYKEIATGIRPVLSKANHYVLNSYKPAWESSDPETASGAYASYSQAANNLSESSSEINSSKPLRGKTIAIAIIILLFMFLLIK